MILQLMWKTGATRYVEIVDFKIAESGKMYYYYAHDMESRVTIDIDNLFKAYLNVNNQKLEVYNCMNKEEY